MSAYYYQFCKVTKLTKNCKCHIIHLTRQSVGECTSPDPANKLISYIRIAVPYFSRDRTAISYVLPRSAKHIT